MKITSRPARPTSPCKLENRGPFWKKICGGLERCQYARCGGCQQWSGDVLPKIYLMQNQIQIKKVSSCLPCPSVFCGFVLFFPSFNLLIIFFYVIWLGNWIEVKPHIQSQSHESTKNIIWKHRADAVKMTLSAAFCRRIVNWPRSYQIEEYSWSHFTFRTDWTNVNDEKQLSYVRRYSALVNSSFSLSDLVINYFLHHHLLLSNVTPSLVLKWRTTAIDKISHTNDWIFSCFTYTYIRYIESISN